MQHVQSSDSGSTTIVPLVATPFICIPKHIYKHITSNGNVITNILDYGQTAKYMSADDLACWMNVNDRFHVSGSRVCTQTLEQATHIPESLLSQWEYISQLAKAKKEDLYDDEGLVACDDYVFHRRAEAHFLVVPKGFIRRVSQIKSVRDKFIKEYIRSIYAPYDDKHIAELPIFRSYLSLFPVV